MASSIFQQFQSRLPPPPPPHKKKKKKKSLHVQKLELSKSTIKWLETATNLRFRNCSCSLVIRTLSCFLYRSTIPSWFAVFVKYKESILQQLKSLSILIWSNAHLFTLYRPTIFVKNHETSYQLLSRANIK